VGLEPAAEERPKITSRLNRRTGIGFALAGSVIGTRSNSGLLTIMARHSMALFWHFVQQVAGLPLLVFLGSVPRRASVPSRLRFRNWKWVK
jgi:hypothetical protein